MRLGYLTRIYSTFVTVELKWCAFCVRNGLCDPSMGGTVAGYSSGNGSRIASVHQWYSAVSPARHHVAVVEVESAGRVGHRLHRQFAQGSAGTCAEGCPFADSTRRPGRKDVGRQRASPSRSCLAVPYSASSWNTLQRYSTWFYSVKRVKHSLRSLQIDIH